jgi:hypothetical protein
MKKLIDNYTFNPTGKKITFNDYDAIELERVLLITNVTRNEIIYSFADPSRGGSVSENVLTLNYDTTGMSATDKLQIWYEDAELPATEQTSKRKLGLSGAGVDTQFTIANANTAYAIPPTPPNDYYTLLLYNSSDSDVFVRFTSGTVNGIKITSGSVFSIDLGPNQQIYVYSPLANTTINLSYKII